MRNEVLVLNSDYEPLNVCNVRRAICLVYKGKAEVLHEESPREDPPCEGPALRSAMPSVVKLRHHVKRPLPELRVSRRSVFARDNYTCQYCGTMSKDLTIDHVRPKRHGGPMSWENLVACCRRCNTRKGDKTPEKAGMTLLRAPRRPRYTPYIELTQYVSGTRHRIWRDYLPVFADIGAAAH
jgi:5-methylcytosine-specific restriction endonuclease McrA